MFSTEFLSTALFICTVHYGMQDLAGRLQTALWYRKFAAYIRMMIGGMAKAGMQFSVPSKFLKHPRQAALQLGRDTNYTRLPMKYDMHMRIICGASAGSQGQGIVLTELSRVTNLAALLNRLARPSNVTTLIYSFPAGCPVLVHFRRRG